MENPHFFSFADPGPGDSVHVITELWKWAIPAIAGALILFLRWTYKSGKRQWDRLIFVDKVLAELEKIRVDLAEVLSRHDYYKARFDARDEVDAVPQWRADGQGHCIWVNEAYCQMTGRERGELLGDGWRKIIHLDDRDQVVREWTETSQGLSHQTVKEGQEYRAEYRIFLNHGSDGSIPVRSVAYPVEHRGEIEWIGSLRRKN